MLGYVVVRGHRALPVRHPPRARALRPGAVLPLLQTPGGGRRDDRGARRRGDACCRRSSIGAIIAIEREIGLRNYIESGIPLDAMLTYDLLVTHLPARVAAARRRGHRPGGPRRGGGLLPAADGEPAAQPRARHAASRRDRPDRGERRRRDRRVRGDRADLAGARRQHRARADARRAARAAAHADHAAARRPARPTRRRTTSS